MSNTDDLYERQEAQGRCQTHGHDWSQSADRRACRRCGATSSYGSNACHNGHDWCCYPDGATCRKCGAVQSRSKYDPNNGGAGW